MHGPPPPFPRPRSPGQSVQPRLLPPPFPRPAGPAGPAAGAQARKRPAPPFPPARPRPVQPAAVGTARRDPPPFPREPPGDALQPSKRDHLDDSDISAVMVPDKGGQVYERHVEIRTTHYFTTLFQATYLYLRFGGPTKHLKTLFSDKAQVQLGTGFRLEKDVKSVKGLEKYDAAHYMNVSLSSEHLALLTVPTDAQSKVKQAWLELYTMSGATSNQFQTSNVSSDKVIDTAQKDCKNWLLGLVADDTGAFDDLIKSGKPDKLLVLLSKALYAYLDALKKKLGGKLENLLKAKKKGTELKTMSYKIAFGVIDAQLKAYEKLAERIAYEVLDFAKKWS